MTERKWTPMIDEEYMEANIVEGDGNIIATIFMDNRTPEHAHLIAAAPDLYEALENAVDALKYGSDYSESNWVVLAANAALAKARGES